MKLRPIGLTSGRPRGLALSSAFLAGVLTLHHSALAQTEGEVSPPSTPDAAAPEDRTSEPDGGADDVPDQGADEQSESAETEQEGTEETATAGAAETQGAGEGKAELKTQEARSEEQLHEEEPSSGEASASLSDGATGPGETSEQGERSSGPEAPPMALELLPSTAYPTSPLPGIKGGSMELTIDRLQWPYMPRYEGAPRLRLGFSGSAWVDSSYRQIKAGLETEDDQTEFRQQGRLKLRATPVYNLEDDWFIQSNIEFVANADQDHTTTDYVDVDDAWIRVGKWKAFDLQVGRMQGFEIYHFGMGLDLNTYERKGATSFSKSPAQVYGATDLWDRGVNTGAVALHMYTPKWLRLEMLTRFGLSGQGNDVGIRPAGVLDFDWVKLKAAYEGRLRSSLFDSSEARVVTKGVGASLQFVANPWVEFGASVGHRVEDAYEEDGAVRPGASHTTLSYGGFVNVRPYFEDWMVGLGYHHTNWENFDFDAFGEPEKSIHDQMFGAVQYMLWDKLYIKYVLSYANGHIEERNDSDPDDDGFENTSLSHRLRLMVLY